MTRQHLEFLISQYLDGTLPAGDVAVLEELLATSAEARGILAEYRSVDRLAKGALPLPEVNWDMLSERIAGAVAQAPAEELAGDEPASRIHEEFEFAITRYLDGQMPAEEVSAFERRLAGDAGAQRVREEYRSLDALMKEGMGPLAAVKWEMLQQRISEAVGAVEVERPGVLFSFKRFAPARLAMAASVVMAMGLAIFFYMNGRGADPISPPGGGGVAAVQLAEVSGPQPEMPAGKASLSIDIGPSRLAANAQYDPYASEAMYAHGQVQLRDAKPVKYQDAVDPF